MSRTQYDALVVGMGPVGLATAFHMAKAGKRVAMIEKREEEKATTRSRGVLLDPSKKMELIKMVGEGEELNDADVAFLDSLLSSTQVEINAVQHFILNRIKNLNEHYKHSLQLGSIDLYYSAALSDLNLAKGKAKINADDKEIKLRFNHLIAADGAKSETRELVNQTLNEGKIQRKIPIGMKHYEKTYHVGANIILSRKDGDRFNIPDREFVSSFLENKKDRKSPKSHRLYFMRFDKKSHHKNDEKSVNFGFVGELPKDIHEKLNKKIMQNQQALADLQHEIQQGTEGLLDQEKQLQEKIKARQDRQKTWALAYIKKAVAHYLHLNEDEIDVKIDAADSQEKNKLEISFFQGQAKKSTKAAIEINGHGFYLAGDAYYTPHYAVGHGLNDGLEAAAKLRNIPTPKTSLSHISAYNELCSSNSNHASRKMQLIRWFRKLGIARFILSKHLEWGVEERERRTQINLKENLVNSIDDPSNEDSIFKFIHEVKFVTLQIEPLIKHGRDAELKAKLAEWKRFIIENPSIFKQYRTDILGELKEINKAMETASEEIKSEFDLIYKAYLEQAKKHNDELIEMARKDPNKLDKSGHSPLYYATQYADLDTVLKIIKLGAIPNEATKYDSIFSNHVRKNENLIHVLFNKGANPFAPFLHDPNYSVFSLAIFGNTQFCDPVFAFECLIAAKYSFHGLFYEARNGLSSKMIDDLNLHIVVYGDDKNSIYMNRLKEFYCGDPKRFIGMLERMNSNDPVLWKWKRNPPSKSDAQIVIGKFNEMTREMLHIIKKEIKEEKSSKFKSSSAKTSFFKRTPAAKNEPKITESKKLKQS